MEGRSSTQSKKVANGSAEIDAAEWITASSTKSKSQRQPKLQPSSQQQQQQQQPIKNGEIRQNGVAQEYKQKEPTPNNNNNVVRTNGEHQQQQPQKSSIYKTTSSGQSGNRPTTTTTSYAQNGLANGDPKKSIEKEIKSLAKHEASFERTRWLFNEEINKSGDRLKRAFAELRDLLSQREKCLFEQLEACKVEGLQMLDQRENVGRDLRAQTERAAKMNDRELNDVRQNIRKYVNERRVEEDCGRTLRFQYEPDKLIELINHFGEVLPLNQAPRKSSSINSLVSADSVETIDANKAVNQVMIGGLLIQSESMDATQLADLTRQLQENLKIQGIGDDIIPEVTGSLGSMPQRRPRTAPNVQSNGRGGGSKRGGARRV